MSLAIDLTKNQAEIEAAAREASALLRQARNVIPPVIYAELQLKFCTIACESARLKTNLGALRMTGDLEQRPPEVRAETLELAEYAYKPPASAPMFPEMGREVKPPSWGDLSRAFLAAGDRTLEEPIFDRHVSVEQNEEDTQRG